MKEKILFTWSSGKDSALALYRLISSGKYEIMALVTTVTAGYERVSMHGTRVGLLDKQAESLGFHMEKVYISKNSSHDDYAKSMRDAILTYKAKGVTTVAFGDLFLEDVRKYREDNLKTLEMKAFFPSWGLSTLGLAQDFVGSGFKAIITCVDTKQIDPGFAGREFDEQLLKDLPRGSDPCGENGEFHTFVYDGPIFKKRIEFKKGVTVLKENRFNYCDLLEPH